MSQIKKLHEQKNHQILFTACLQDFRNFAAIVKSRSNMSTIFNFCSSSNKCTA